MPAVCFHSITRESYNIAVQEPNEATAGAQQRLIMTPTGSGDSAPAAFYVTVAIRMVTAAIFRSRMAGKCTRLAPLRMEPGPGAPPLTIMTWTNSGVTVEVNYLINN